MGPPEVSSLPTVGSRHHLSITDLAFGGKAWAHRRIRGLCPFVIRGEEVEVEVTEVKRQFAARG
jgi:predicted RNA-binding protein with TRAM domain